MHPIKSAVIAVLFFLISTAVSASDDPVITSIRSAAYISGSTQGVKRSAKEGEIMNPGDYLQVPRGHYAVIQSGKDLPRVSGGTVIGRVQNRLLKFEVEPGGEIQGLMEGGTPGGIEILTSNASAKIKDSYFTLTDSGTQTQAMVYRGGVSFNAQEDGGVTGSTLLRQAQSTFVKKDEKEPHPSFLLMRSDFERFNATLKELNNPAQLNYDDSLQSLFRGIPDKERRRLLRNSPGVARELNSGSLRLVGSDESVDDLEDQAADESDRISRWGDVLF
ncbi:MAG: hypothetical protein KC649_02170 [Candidatus Omnitrophica bacterium]|nr:hypothetical protein [Candidatus Omnitrophota bacterium]